MGVEKFKQGDKVTISTTKQQGEVDSVDTVDDLVKVKIDGEIVGFAPNMLTINENLTRENNDKIITYKDAKKYYSGYVKERLVEDFVNAHNALVTLKAAVKDSEDEKVKAAFKEINLKYPSAVFYN